MNLIVVAVAVLAYFIGAIPIGYVVAKIKGIADIRKHGSGNSGATNVSRTLGLPYFFLIFFLDAGKAFFFIYAMQTYFSLEYLYFFAFILLIGNGCSLFLYGSGGKGVATLFGLVAALNFWAVWLMLGIWLLILGLTHTVGIASICSVICLPLYALLLHDYAFLLFSLCAASWIIWKHESNIRRYWEFYCIKK